MRRISNYRWVTESDNGKYTLQYIKNAKASIPQAPWVQDRLTDRDQSFLIWETEKGEQEGFICGKRTRWLAVRAINELQSRDLEKIVPKAERKERKSEYSITIHIPPTKFEVGDKLPYHGEFMVIEELPKPTKHGILNFRTNKGIAIFHEKAEDVKIIRKIS